MLSKALVTGAYQRKLEALATEPDLDLTVAVPPEWRDHGRRLPLERAYTHGYNLHIEPIRFNGSFHFHYYPRLGRLMRAVQPDLVHIDEEPYNLATWHALRLSLGAGARVIWFSWQNLYRQYPPPFRWLERDVLNRSHGAIFGNHAAREVFRRKGYAGPAAIIPQFGVDPGLFPLRQGWPAPQRHLRLAYLGRLVPEKGPDLLLRALAALDSASTLDLVGAGPMQAELEAQARQLGIADRVRFHPWIASTDVPAFLASVDVVVLPSRTRPNWMEQFGRVLIEAMAVGVPVVGASSGEIPNVVGDAGLIFPENDGDALVAALARLGNDSTLYQSLVTAGRQRVLAHYTQAQIAAQTAAFYRQIVSH